ncbi:MAG TPA: helix-turn-helix domain-containing protein, partial [Cellvibrio sp.]|nr:helix-turn-helix domain-containing protein [Cellvibrio sp.]
MSIDVTGIDSLAPNEGEPSTLSNTSDTATRLKLIRDAFGFSQRELAKRAGMTNSSISMIEQGQVSPSIHTLSRILSAYPLSLGDFFRFNCEPGGRIYRSGSIQPV